MTRAMNRDVSDLKEMEEEDKIFIEMPIPRTLSEIGFLQAEKDIKAGKDGGGSALYAIVSGLKKDMSGAAQQPNILAGKLVYRHYCSWSRTELLHYYIFGPVLFP